MELRFETEVRDLAPDRDADLVLAADGVNSAVRGPLRASASAARSTCARTGSCGSARPARSRPSRSSSRRTRTGSGGSTPTATTRGDVDLHRRVHGRDLAARGARRGDEDDTVAFCEALFADELEGHRLLKNRSLWRSFPTVRNERWHHGNVVLLGDAAHTAHFSVGSGTKLAMEDAIALAARSSATGEVAGGARGLRGGAAARGREPAARGPGEPRVVRGHRALHASRAGPVRVSLLTRSLRVTHENLRVRDPAVRRHGGPVVRRARPSQQSGRAAAGRGRARSAADVHAVPPART